MKPRFLTVDDVRVLHLIAIQDQAGDNGIRDFGLLESAVTTPAQQFAGEFVHPDIPSMAAAYAFHISSNHPFIDGNKRAAAAAMIALLTDNGWIFNPPTDEAERMFLQLAAGRVGKSDFTDWVRRHMELVTSE